MQGAWGGHCGHWNGLLNVKVSLPKKHCMIASVLEARCGTNVQSMLPRLYGQMHSLAELSSVLWVSGILSSGQQRLLPVVSAYFPLNPGCRPLGFPQNWWTSDISLGSLPWGLCPLKSSLCGVKNSMFLPWSVICPCRAVAGAMGEGEGLVPLSACRALKCNSLEESHHHHRKNYFHRRKNTLREIVQTVVCAAVFK